jgi:radical SAM superfamily enzyme YgiQ (UPF0313 family)
LGKHENCEFQVLYPTLRLTQNDRASSSMKFISQDFLNVLYLTPLPGTRLWKKMKSEGRITANTFPYDWKYYTLIFPVARYKKLSWQDMITENFKCNSNFYSFKNISKRIIKNLFHARKPLITAVINITYRNNAVTNFFGKFAEFDLSRGEIIEY